VNKNGFVLSLLLLVTGSHLPAQNPYIRHFTTQDGLPSNMVYYLYQDSRKFLWMATDAGVSRYDGTTFTNFRKKDGLSSNEVIRIREDSAGRIWFFNLNATMDFFSRDTLHNFRNTPFLKSLTSENYFLDFFQDEVQRMTFFNKSTIFYFLDAENKVTSMTMDRKAWATFLNNHSLTAGSTILITPLPGNNLVFWAENGIFRYSLQNHEYSIICDTLQLKGVFPAEDGTFYLVTDHRTILQLADMKIARSYHLPCCFPGAGITIKSVLQDRDGGLWVVTFNEGVYRTDPDGNIRHFDISEGQSILQDNEHNIWVSSMKDGIYRISPFQSIHKHHEASEFQDRGILGLCKATGKGIWMTNGKSAFLYSDNGFHRLDYPNDKYLFNYIRQFSNTQVLVGEKSFHFMNFSGLHPDPSGKLIRFTSRVDLPVQFKNFAINRTQTKVCANGSRMIAIFDAGDLNQNTVNIDVNERTFNAFYNLENELVVNAVKTYIYRDGALAENNYLSHLNNRIITDHQIINDTTELFITEGDSVFLCCRNHFFNLSEAFDTPIELQIRNTAYSRAVLYLSTSRNVYWCNNPLDVVLRRKVRLQLLDLDFRNIHEILACNDSLYIASDDGLTVIPGARMGRQEVHVPIPYFRSISINDRDQNPEKAGMPVRGITKLAITFGSISYSSAPLVYAYKLEGLDTAWTIGTSENVMYQHLVRGHYTFRLKVRKSTAEWSREIEYPLEIRASVWRHPLFFTGLAILSLAGIGLILLRRKNLQIKSRELDHHLVTLELKSLQSMMNPHFIFNALASIQNFILQNKTGEAGLYLSRFARLIRLNMNAIQSAMVNLDEEFDRLTNYLDLEQLRMEQRFTYKVDVDEGFDPEEVMIPSMIVQPFVENSIWHGISQLEEAGRVTILFTLMDDQTMKVTITDNGIGMARAKAFQNPGGTHLKMGMEMTRKRLELMGRKFGVQTRIDFAEACPGATNPGTRVEMIMPCSCTGKPSSPEV